MTFLTERTSLVTRLFDIALLAPPITKEDEKLNSQIADVGERSARR
jgi:hypothetical protein